MNKRLQRLTAERHAALTQMRQMLSAAEGENRDLTAEETETYSALEQKVDTLNASIEREQKLADHERRVASVANPGNPGTGVTRVTNVHNRAADQQYATLGEQLADIAAVGKAQAGVGSVGEDTYARLHGAAPSGASANSGPDGGFLIQRDFATDLANSGYETGILSSRCSTTEVGEGSDGLEVVTIDETSRATGSRWGGVQVFRRKEADTVNSTKVKFGEWERRLEDMMGLAYVTERALQDASALGQVFEEAFNEEFGWKLDSEIWEGTGVGECLGVTKSPVFVSVPAVAGQTAGTIVAQNIIDIWARVPARSRTRGIWVYNQEAEPQLQTLTIGAGAGIIPVFMPPGGLSGSQYNTIYGRAALPIEQANPLGQVGDIAYLDLSQYKLIRKGLVQKDESIHVRFIYGERAFRWMMRVNGAPKAKAPLSPAKGTNKLSPFVGIAAR